MLENRSMPKESDWKLFRKKLPQWQEHYMQKLLNEYAGIIAAAGSAADKFWKLEKRLRKDVRHTGVIAEMRRSVMGMNIISLLNEGAITSDDLEDFSDDLKAYVSIFLGKDIWQTNS